MGKLHLQKLGLSLENLLSFLDPFGEGEAEGQLVAAGEDNVVAVVQQGYALVPSVNHRFKKIKGVLLPNPTNKYFLICMSYHNHFSFILISTYH